MLKKLKASFKNIKDFVLPERTYNIWIRYFCETAPVALPSVPEKSPMSGHYANFNFADVKGRAIVAESKAIESNPQEALKVMLNLEQPISPHYFKFCRSLFQSNLQEAQIKKIVDESSIHLMRAFIAFEFQFDTNFAKLVTGQDLPFFKLTLLDEVPFLIDALLRSSVVRDFVYILNLLLKNLLRAVETNGKVQDSTMKVFHLLLMFLRENRNRFEEDGLIVTFIVGVFSHCDDIDKVFADFCDFVSDEPDGMIKLYSDEVYHDFLTNIGKVLYRISDGPKNEAQYQIGLSCLNCLNVCLYKRGASFSVMDSILKFIKWTYVFEDIPDMEVKEKVEEEVPLDNSRSDWTWGFVEGERIEFNAEVCKVQYPDTEVFETKFPHLTKIVIVLSSLMRINEDFVKHIVSECKREKDVFLIYIVTKALTKCPVEMIVTTMKDCEAWSSFLSPSVINAETFTNRVGDCLIDFRNLILNICSRVDIDDSGRMMTAFAEFLTGKSPIVVTHIIELLDSMYTVRQQANVMNSPVIDFGVRVSNRYRVSGITQDQKNARSAIWHFVYQFCGTTDALEFMFSNETRSKYVIAMVFEQPLFEISMNVICRGLEHVHSSQISKNIYGIFKTVLETNAIDERWMELIWAFLDCISASLPFNEARIIHNIISSNLVALLPRIPEAIRGTGDEGNTRKYMNRVIQFLTKLCKNSLEFRASLSRPAWNVVKTFEKTLSEMTIDDSVVTTLINFAQQEQTLAIVEGIELLFFITSKDDYSEKVLQYFVGMTKNSVANRYQCFRANMISKLLELVEQRPLPVAFQLFAQIGASFFRMSELSLTLRLLSQTQKSFALPLLDAVLKMIELHDPCAPKSFFHFLETETFTLPQFTVSNAFTLSLDVCFDELESTKEIFLSMANSKKKLELGLNDCQISATVDSGKKVSQFVLSSDISRGKWYRLQFVVNPSKISLLIDGKVQTSVSLPSRFKFEKEPVTVVISNIFCDAESIKVESKDGTVYGHFSAKCVNGTKCKNIGSSSGIGDADFNGLSVPFSMSIVETLPISGGPVVILPLFDHIDKSEKPNEFFKKLLSLLERLLSENISMFQNQVFFRSLGHILGRVDVDTFTVDCIDVLYLMYKQNDDEMIRSEMLRHIFSDVDLWYRMSEDNQLYVFSGIYTGLFQTCPKTFQQTVSFGELVIRFSSLFEQKNVKPELVQRCWNFLIMLSSEGIDEREARLLVASAMRITNDSTCVNSMKIIVNLISDNSPSLCGYLNGIGMLKPFCAVVNSRFEMTRITALSVMYYILNVLNPADASVQMIDCIRLWNSYETSAVTVNNIMAFLTQKAAKDFPSIVSDFDYSDDAVAPILMPQFLPVLCAVVSLLPLEVVTRATEYLRKSYNTFTESGKSVEKCEYWISWMIFLSLYDHEQQEWIKVITKNILLVGNYVQDAMLFSLVGSVVGFSTQYYTMNILTDAFKENPTIDTAHFLLRNLLFFAEIEKCEPVKENSIHTFAQKFVMLGKLKINVSFQPHFSDFERLTLAISVVKFLISQGLDYLCRPNALFPTLALPNFCLLSYVIHQIALESTADGLELMKGIISAIQKVRMKPELCTGVFLLLAFFSDDESAREILINKLKDLDVTWMTSTLETLAPVMDKMKEQTQSDLEQAVENVIQLLGNEYSELQKRIQRDFSRVFEDVALVNGSHTERLLSDNRNRLLLEITQLNNDKSRMRRVNAKSWKSMFKKMSNEYGGPWSQIGDGLLHFKFDTVVDRIWRRNKMKINPHFDDHKDASLARDTGEESESKTICGTNVEKTDEVVDTPRIYTLELECKMITTTRCFKGSLYLSNESMAFEAKETTDAFGDIIDKMSKLIDVNINSILFVMKRRYLHIDCACEVFTTAHKSYFLILANQHARQRFFRELKSLKPRNLKFIQTKEASDIYNALKLEKQWKSGAMSNFEYLSWLNMLSGRSIHDLSQYPVYPWVLSNYSSETLDVNDDSNYRDLTKPIGALNEERLATLRNLYEEMKDTPFASLYRFHYSAPAYVISYMIRREPFVSLHIQLQNGKFDHPNRLFFSVMDAWKSVTSLQSDFRELIPEFFATPEFLLNSEHYDLGMRRTFQVVDTEENSKEMVEGIGVPVDDVQLPPWAKSAAAFVALNRIALESRTVSEHLHEWIDLVFGCKQCSEEANTIFHPYSYSKSVTEEPEMIPTIQQHAANFGITPQCMFTTPHVARNFKPKRLILMENQETFLTPEPVYEFQKDMLRFEVSLNNLTVLFKDGSLTTYVLSEKSGVISNKTAHIEIPSLVTRDEVLLLGDNSVIVSPPWMQSFIYYPGGRRKAAPTGGHSAVITAFAVDGAYCVTAAADSSILVWILDMERPVTNVVAHTSAVKAIAVCEESEVIVSVDVHGHLVFSALRNGGFMQHVKLDEVPNRVLLSSLGFCVLLFEEHEEAAVNTKVMLMDLHGRILETKKFEGKCTCASIIKNKDASSFLVIAQETNLVYIMTVWDLSVVVAGPLRGAVCDMSYNPTDALLYFCLENGSLQRTSFEKH